MNLNGRCRLRNLASVTSEGRTSFVLLFLIFWISLSTSLNSPMHEWSNGRWTFDHWPLTTDLWPLTFVNCLTLKCSFPEELKNKTKNVANFLWLFYFFDSLLLWGCGRVRGQRSVSRVKVRVRVCPLRWIVNRHSQKDCFESEALAKALARCRSCVATYIIAHRKYACAVRGKERFQESKWEMGEQLRWKH